MNTLPIECKIHIFEYLYKSSLKNVYVSSKENKEIIDKYIELKDEFIIFEHEMTNTPIFGKKVSCDIARGSDFIWSNLSGNFNLPLIPVQMCNVNIEIEFEKESDPEKENKKRMKHKKIKPKLQKKLDKRKNYVFKKNSKRF